MNCRIKRQKIAIENYKKFCNLEGSDFIASEFALETLLRLVECFKVKSVLEVGMGIGSVSDTILCYLGDCKEGVVYHGTENNEYCLNVLPKNVTYFKRIVVFPSLDSLPIRKYDLIVIDGSDKRLIKLKEICSENAILFIEGGRLDQTNMLLELFPKSLYVNVITLKKNPPYAHEGRSSESYIGGGQLLFVNPTFMMKIFWLKEKLSTFVKIKIRKLKRNILKN